LGAAKKVLAVCEAKSDGVTANVRPRVIVPDDVIGPPVQVFAVLSKLVMGLFVGFGGLVIICMLSLVTLFTE